MALSSFHGPGLPQAATRVRRGGSAAGAKTSGIFQRAGGQFVERTHLHQRQTWAAGAAADHLPWDIWHRFFPGRLRGAIVGWDHVLHLAGVLRAGDVAAVFFLGAVSVFAPDCNCQPRRLSRCVHRGGHSAGVAPKEVAAMVARAGCMAVLPTTDCARMGTVSRAAGTAASGVVGRSAAAWPSGYGRVAGTVLLLVARGPLAIGCHPKRHLHFGADALAAQRGHRLE